MLVDGFNDLHGFRASVPDDGEFDGVMGFAVPVLHVSVKERGAALLTLLSQFRQSNVEESELLPDGLAEFESQLAYQSRIMREDRIMRF